MLENTDFKGIVVIDEAYIDFADPYGDDSADVSAARLVHEYANICVMQTLSKSFGLAAIRYAMYDRTYICVLTTFCLVKTWYSPRAITLDTNAFKHKSTL